MRNADNGEFPSIGHLSLVVYVVWRVLCRSLFSIVNAVCVYCNVSKSISVQMNEPNAIIIIIIITNVRDVENAIAPAHK